jgi:hypothetical protein
MMKQMMIMQLQFSARRWLAQLAAAVLLLLLLLLGLLRHLKSA